MIQVYVMMFFMHKKAFFLSLKKSFQCYVLNFSLVIYLCTMQVMTRNVLLREEHVRTTVLPALEATTVTFVQDLFTGDAVYQTHLLVD